jgi:membrane protein implicated in regulation of membrane protease activity
MKFQVPQFIETETKLIGPLTLRQFLWVAGGASMIAMEFILLNGIFFLVAALITGGFFGALAFLKVDGQPFINYLAYMLGYFLGAKRYIYQPKQDGEVLSSKLQD